MNYYPLLLSIKDVLNDWNEKLNDFTAGHMDNVIVGAAVVGLIFVISAWGISTLNKK